MENIRANIGEWSEVYTLIKLLKDGRIYAADEALVSTDMFLPIIRIRREEVDGERYDYYTATTENPRIRIYHNGDFIKELDMEQFDECAVYMYHKLSTAGNGGISLEQFGNLGRLLEEMNVNKTKAGTDVKADIIMEIIDVNTGYRPIAGFSIKSKLGSAPTLFNASEATNFKFRLNGMNDELMTHINAINTRTKIIDRVKAILEAGVTLSFEGVQNQNFTDNLEMIDSYMPKIVANILLYYYCDGIKDCNKLMEKICHDNPLGYHRADNYIYKFKKLLCSIALGMIPSKKWDGLDEANGGYIVVKENGDIVCYYIYNRNAFEAYLLNYTKMDRPSSTRHKYAKIEKDSNGYYINLNFQIRFK